MTHAAFSSTTKHESSLFEVAQNQGLAATFEGMSAPG
jgi:hypothetical protein